MEVTVEMSMIASIVRMAIWWNKASSNARNTNETDMAGNEKCARIEAWHWFPIPIRHRIRPCRQAAYKKICHLKAEIVGGIRLRPDPHDKKSVYALEAKKRVYNHVSQSSTCILQ
jgi:hypothetical protein